MREPELLKALYYHANKPLEAAELATRDAYRSASWAKRMRGLSIALQFFQNHATAKEAGANAAQCAFLAKSVDEQLKLLDAQRSLEQEAKDAPPPPGMPAAAAAGPHKFIDTPLNETIYRCFAYGKPEHAERLKAELKLPERRWWRLKLKGLAHARDWERLWAELGSSRKSPIGFKPFADACVEQGAFDEAARYAAKLAAADAVPLYLKLGRIDEARRVAVQHKDKQPELLRMITEYSAVGLGGGPS